MRKWITLFFSLAIAVMSVLPAAAQSADQAYLRVGHFSADAPAVDVYLNGELSAVENLSYGNVSTWAAVPAGVYSVAIVPAGGDLADAAATVDEVELKAGDWVTVSAVGSGKALRLQPAVEDYKTPVQAGTTRVSLFHAIEGMTGVDLTRQGVAMLSRVTYPDPALGNDGAASVELAAGTFDLQVTAAGRADAVLAALPQTVLDSQNYVSIFVYGTIQDTLAVIEVVTPDDVATVTSGGTLVDDEVVASSTEAPDTPEEPGEAVDIPLVTAADIEGDAAFIRFAHFAADTAAVDLYLNGELSVFQGIDNSSVTPWTAIPAGVYRIGIVPAGGSGDLATVEEVEIKARSWVTVSAVGSGNALHLQPAFEDFATPVAAGTTRVTLFHAIEGMTGIDLTRQGVAMLSRVTYPDPALGNDGAASVELAAGTFDLQVTAAGRADAVLAALPQTVLESGAYVAIFAYGTIQDTLYVIQVTTPDDVATLRGE